MFQVVQRPGVHCVYTPAALYNPTTGVADQAAARYCTLKTRMPYMSVFEANGCQISLVKFENK